jgi:DNA uptake protein ComE-like DNA-binding protein
MKNKLVVTTLMTASLLLGGHVTYAADTKANTPLAPASQAKQATKTAAKPQTTSKVKVVDINSANAAELKTLPGIGEAEAAKIIAARPFGSKAWLVTKGILPEDKYPGLKDLVIAKQPFSDGNKNVAALKKAQKPASQ